MILKGPFYVVPETKQDFFRFVLNFFFVFIHIYLFIIILFWILG